MENTPCLVKEHGNVLGLKDIYIDRQEGEITVIIWLSGSGKSTLIRHLNRLVEPTTRSRRDPVERSDGAALADLDAFTRS